MFEFEHHIVQQLLEGNQDFKRLYEKHTELNSRVDQANAGILHMDDRELEIIKKEKLYLRDQMARMIQGQKPSTASA